MNHKALKRILVTMPDKCAALLKSYAAQWGMTQSEVLYECSRNHIHAQANSGCVGTLNLLHIHDIKLDRRAHKMCYGYACRICKHDKPCRVGKYEGYWECDERYKHLLSENVHA